MSFFSHNECSCIRGQTTPTETIQTAENEYVYQDPSLSSRFIHPFPKQRACSQAINIKLLSFDCFVTYEYGHRLFLFHEKYSYRSPVLTHHKQIRSEQPGARFSKGPVTLQAGNQIFR